MLLIVSHSGLQVVVQPRHFGIQLERAVKKGLRSQKPYVIDVMMTRESLEKPGFVGN